MSEVTQNAETQTAAEAAHNQLAVLSPERRAELALNSKDTALQLQQLVAESADITEVTDKDSREMAHNAAMKLKNTRIAIEKVGKAAREDAQAFSKAVIAEEKRLKEIITPEEARVFKLRDEYDQKVEAERQERERNEIARVAAIRERIDAIKALPLDSADDGSQQLTQTIQELTDFAIDDSFAEFKEDAEAAKWEAIGILQRLFDAACSREAAAAQLAAENARLQAERDKLEAERAEFEAWKAQQAAQQQPEPVAEVQPAPEVDEVQAEPVQEEPAPAEAQPALFGDVAQDAEPENDESSNDEEDAQAFTRKLANVMAMQFVALADKVQAIGHVEFADTLRDDAKAIESGIFDDRILAANWTMMADADKAMAIASHAGVALVYGNQEMGGSVLLQAAE